MARGDDDPTTDPPDYQAGLWMIRFGDWHGRTRWGRVKLVAGFTWWFLKTRDALTLSREAWADHEYFRVFIRPRLKRLLGRGRTLH